jgi:hypothetical protein
VTRARTSTDWAAAVRPVKSAWSITCRDTGLPTGTTGIGGSPAGRAIPPASDTPRNATYTAKGRRLMSGSSFHAATRPSKGEGKGPAGPIVFGEAAVQQIRAKPGFSPEPDWQRPEAKQVFNATRNLPVDRGLPVE